MRTGRRNESKTFSISSLVKRAFTFRKKTGAAVIKTLIDRFRYPAHGPGEMWEVLTKKIEERGATVQMGESVVSIKRGSRESLRLAPLGRTALAAMAARISSRPWRFANWLRRWIQ